MNKLLRVIAILIMSMCSVAAYALSSVKDVEAELSKGNYEEAKTMLKEVLKTNPDSVVAHKYMLQVFDIEYAQTLKPSVEYKLYEAGLANAYQKIAAEKARIAEAERKALEAKREAERKERHAQTLKAMGWAVLLASIIGGGYFGYRFIEIRNARKREAEEEQEWYNSAYADIIDINKLVSIMRANIENKDNVYDAQSRHLLTVLDNDNQDVQGCLDRHDFHRGSVIQHIRDAYSFFDEKGVTINDA
jgi:hypothetical protein